MQLPALPDQFALSRLAWGFRLMTALGAIGLILLIRNASDWSVSVGELLGWPVTLTLIGASGIALHAALPPRVGQLSSAFAGTAAAGVIASQMWTLAGSWDLPAWLAWLTLTVAMACILLLAVAISGSDEAASRGIEAADGFLLVLAVVSACSAAAILIGSERGGFAILMATGVTGLASWALWSLRTGRRGWVVPTVAGLLVAAALGNWTDSLPGIIGSLCGLTGAVLIVSSGLREGTPWARVGTRSRSDSPALGTAQGAGPISIAWADLVAWVRSAWPAMALAGGLFWMTLVLLVVITFTPLWVLAPLAALVPFGVGGDGASESTTAASLVAVVWLVVGTQVIATAFGQALGLLSSQALAGAAAEHDGVGRVRGTALAKRSLSIFWSQLGTVALYTLGVLIGTMFCVVPGIYLQIRWAFALPVGAHRGVRGSPALGASWRLTQNRVWLTVGASLTGAGITIAAIVVGSVVALGTQLIFGSALIGSLAAMAFVAFGVTCSAVVIASVYRQFVAADAVTGPQSAGR